MRVQRLRRLAWVFAALVALMIGRLFQLQILQGERWLREARISRLDRATLPFRRGRILDRNGELLAIDRPSYDLYFRYRDFRREHVFGQLLEALLLRQLPVDGGLVAIASQGEALGELLLGLGGDEVAAMPRATRGDFLFYFSRACGAGRGPLRQALDEVVEAADPHALGDLLPALRDGLAQELEQARRQWRTLESTLGPAWRGLLLPRLEQRRRELELMVARSLMQEAAAKVLDLSAAGLRELLGDPDATLSEEAQAALASLRDRWQLRGEASALRRVLLARHADAPAADPLSWVPVLHAMEQQVQAVQPIDLAGIRKEQTRRIHHLRVIALQRDLNFEQVDLLAQQAAVYPGLYLEEVTRRLYPHEIEPPLIGSVRLPSAADLESLAQDRERYRELARKFYRDAAEEAEFRQLQHRQLSEALRPDESKGADGVELVYEPVLRGRRGYLQVLKGGDEGMQPLELQFFPAHDGEDVTLALDIELEQAAQQAIAETYANTLENLRSFWTTAPPSEDFDPEHPKVGFVLLDLATGETPLLCSTPTLGREEIRRQWAELLKLRSGSPLRQRALGGGFQLEETPFPGSTFKPLVAAAALSIDPSLWEREYECLGHYTPIPGGNTLRCDARYGHQTLTMRDALKKSCNIYFYKLAEEIGAEALEDYARRLGFGHATGIELVQELPPQAPGEGPQWRGSTGLEKGVNLLATKEQMARDRLLLMRVAIGQQGVQASPLQMARFYGWLATGKLFQPRLVLKGGGATPAVPIPDLPPLADAQRARLIDALSAVSYESGGTAAHTAFPQEWGIVAKTGTAQIRTGSHPIPTHAWFTGFFPREHPRYAFAILCENTGLHGGQIASFILKAFLETEAGSRLLEVAQ